MITINPSLSKIVTIFLIVIIFAASFNPSPVFACLSEDLKDAEVKRDKAEQDFKDAVKEVERLQKEVDEAREAYIIETVSMGGLPPISPSDIANSIEQGKLEGGYEKLRRLQRERDAADKEAKLYYEIWKT